MNESLIVNAQSYAARRQLEIAERLGSGKDGTVFVAKRKIASAKVAIKAHRFEELYFREKLAYERLRKLEINSIQGFNVPEMADFDDNLRILEMTIVKRPFVLDFVQRILTGVPSSRPKSGQNGKRKNASNSKDAGLSFSKSWTHLKRSGCI